MLFTMNDIIAICRRIAPTHGFDPRLIAAIARQECQPARDKSGRLDASVARLEQTFYSVYVERRLQLPSTVEAQFATSWGVWQLMGLSLFDLHFFEYWFNTIPDQNWKTKVLKDPLGELTVTQALNWYAVMLEAQCGYACQHLAAKRKLANGMAAFKGETDKERMMLLLWNGGANTQYDDEVLAKKQKLIEEGY